MHQHKTNTQRIAHIENARISAEEQRKRLAHKLLLFHFDDAIFSTILFRFKNTPGSRARISSMLISLHDDVDLDDILKFRPNGICLFFQFISFYFLLSKNSFYSQ